MHPLPLQVDSSNFELLRLSPNNRTEQRIGKDDGEQSNDACVATVALDLFTNQNHFINTFQFSSEKSTRLSPIMTIMNSDRTSDAQIIRQHSGEFWECIERTSSSTESGWIYQFQIKEEFAPWTSNYKNTTQERLNTIFPAVEPTWDQAYEYIISKTTLDSTFENRTSRATFSSTPEEVFRCWKHYLHLHGKDLRIKYNWKTEKLMKTIINKIIKNWIDTSKKSLSFIDSALNELGFKQELRLVNKKENIILELPDREALMGGWAKLQEKNPKLNLPELKIFEIQGTLEDDAFLNGYCNTDILISSDKEFVHDMINHAIPVIILIISSQFSLMIPDSERLHKGDPEKKQWVDFFIDYFRLRIINNQRSYELIKNKRAFFIHSSLKILERGDQLITQSDRRRKSFDLIKITLSAYIDGLTTIEVPNDAYEALQYSLKEISEKMFSNPRWFSYFEQRNGEPINRERMTEEWNQIFELIEIDLLLEERKKVTSWIHGRFKSID